MSGQSHHPPEVQLLQTGVCQVISGPLVDVPLRLDLVIVGQTVHFVDEHLEVDLGVDPVGPRHGEVKSAQGLHIVVLHVRGGEE